MPASLSTMEKVRKRRERIAQLPEGTMRRFEPAEKSKAGTFYRDVYRVGRIARQDVTKKGVIRIYVFNKAAV